MADGKVVSTRTQLLNAWKGNGKDFLLVTRPYKSADALIGKVIESHAELDGSGMFHLVVFEKGSEISFFSKGLSDSHPFYGALTSADTNQVTGYRTNGGEDYCIEGMSAYCRSVRTIFTAGYAAQFTSDRVKAALNGGVLCDPGCIMSPPQISSPLNLEQAIYEAVAPHISTHIEFNRERMEYVGDLGQFPEGNGRSFLRAHGVPDTHNRYRIPEGYQWKGADGADSQLRVVGKLERDVIVPLSAVVTPTMLVKTTVEAIALDLCFKLHGGAMRYPSKN